MSRTEPCKKCGKNIDTRGLKAHEKNCKGKPGKAAAKLHELTLAAREIVSEIPPENPPEIPPEKQATQPETIVIKQDFSEVPALPGQIQPEAQNGTASPISPVFPGQKADIFDFDEQDCSYAYGSLMETGALLLADSDVQLPENRVNARGKVLHRIMVKYNLSFKYLDLAFFGLGVAGDIAFMVRELKAKNPKGDAKDALKTDGTNHEIIEQPKAPEKPKSLLSAGAVKAP